jgi:phosphoglycolate phosphatase-like HAD superfamily hydrolase
MINANICNIIFDLDGTLIDSSEGIIETTNYALKAMGEPMRSPDEIISYIGCPLDERFYSFSDKSYDHFLKLFRDYGNKVIVEASQPLDGADIVLAVLHHGGIRLGIGTIKSRLHIDGILERLGWDDLITASVGGNEVTNVKPHPEQFVKVMDLLGARVDNTLVVGDTINDIKAARAAGLPVAAVKSPFGNNNYKEEEPDIYLECIADLPAELERIKT